MSDRKESAMSERQTIAMPAASRGRLAPPRARIGLIIPSMNTLSEPQFAHYCPTDLGIHVARLRMSGKWKRPFAELGADIAAAASSLADADPDLIVFHCTGASMREGPAGDIQVRQIIHRAAGIESITTGGAIVEALHALAIKKLVLISPYVQSNNDSEVAYLHKAGFSVIADVALGLRGSVDYIAVPPERWVRIALDNARAEADGYLLCCTNTTQIEAITEIEQVLGKPVINSNQAVMWACLDRLRSALDIAGRLPGVGRLMSATAGSHGRMSSVQGQ
jgi:maleate cis-trans isomerase